MMKPPWPSYGGFSDGVYMICSLYVLKSSENKYYIGVSHTPNIRLNAHLSGNGSRLIKEALQEGITFTADIIAEGDTEEIYALEKDAIIEYDALSPKGYNISEGGFIGGISNRKGSLNSQAKLTEEIVLNIREEYRNLNTTQEALASRYGVNRETISALVRGKSWSHIGGPITVKTNQSRKLDDESIKLIKHLRATTNLTYTEISKQTGIPRGTVAKYGSIK